jgi:glycerol-3-phosphate dehydrogenase
VWAFAGVRSLHDGSGASAKDLSRDYVLELDAAGQEAPLLSIYGGKITTARRLAEEALGRLTRFLQMPPPWTHLAPLPGGDFPWDGVAALAQRARGLWPFLSEAQALRLVRAYGNRLDRIMGAARRPEDLGPRLAGDLTGAEASYLMCHEWAETSDDILWRRSKLGLHVKPDEREALARFIEAHGRPVAAAE